MRRSRVPFAIRGLAATLASASQSPGSKHYPLSHFTLETALSCFSSLENSTSHASMNAPAKPRYPFRFKKSQQKLAQEGATTESSPNIDLSHDVKISATA
ncbi:hypothetical protein [Caballeronia sp. dw_19]|uniref:hypothetical protein n=1 Tax=Caballeronia sp. dw_19 TaxID=2719791 RepID=UPI001BD439D3|nr:hypothetical protein [Caballeronia sp. dw_19]